MKILSGGWKILVIDAALKGRRLLQGSRESKNDFKRFLQISLGSAYELETDLIIAESLQFVKSDDLQKYLTGLHLEQRRLNSLISRIKAN